MILNQVINEFLEIDDKSIDYIKISEIKESKFMKNISSYFIVRHNRSMYTLSAQRPLPSMLIFMSCCASMVHQLSLVNWHPWSLLTISGFPLVNAIAQACSHDGVSKNTKIFQPIILLLYTSIKQTK